MNAQRVQRGDGPSHRARRAPADGHPQARNAALRQDDGPRTPDRLQAYRDLRDKMATEMMSEGRSELALVQDARESSRPMATCCSRTCPDSSSLERFKYTDVKREVLSYLTDHGAPQKEAEGLGALHRPVQQPVPDRHPD